MLRLKMIRVVSMSAVLCFCLVAAIPAVSQAKGKTSGLSGSLNVNTATVKELSMLPGIGKKTAEAIIAYREQNGNFTSVDELLKVKGIGKKTLANCVDYIVLEGENTLKKGNP